jgi:AcrR family transcriptional regulator
VGTVTARRRRVVLAEVVRVLPRRAHDLSRRIVAESQRWRLLEAMIETVAKVGYANASVADAIAIAGVSRKTFYEHFRDKEACFLAAYDAVSRRLLEAIIATGAAHPIGPIRRRAQLARLLHGLASDPLGARVFLVEIPAAGAKAIRARQRRDVEFARAFLDDLDPIERTAIAGGVNAVIIAELLDGRAARLPALLDVLAAFVEHALQ